MMTAQAASRLPDDRPPEKTAGKKQGGRKTALHVISDYSLSGFLEDEPDLYSVSDIKVRNR
jgi:hypothetical protein